MALTMNIYPTARVEHTQTSQAIETRSEEFIRPLYSIKGAFASDGSRSGDFKKSKISKCYEELLTVERHPQTEVRRLVTDDEVDQLPVTPRLQVWEDFGHQFEAGELEILKRSIAEMALSRINGEDELYVGGIWALRRSDSLTDRRITHVLSMVGFNPSSMKNFKDEPWSHYGRDFEHLLIDIDDVDDTDLLIELPRAVRFIHSGLQTDNSRPAKPRPTTTGADELGAVSLEEGLESSSVGLEKTKGSGVFVHCAAGKSRSVAVTIAYLLWRYPERFDPNIVGTRQDAGGDDASASHPPAAASPPAGPPAIRPRRQTANEAVGAALDYIRRTRPMADPNDGFMHQLELWWEMGCPADKDIETHPIYQRWAYRREVEENVAVGQAPSRLRFEDEEGGGAAAAEDGSGTSLKCKKCRRALAKSPFIIDHKPSPENHGRIGGPCPHFFVEPLSWMRSELEKGTLNGRLQCPNQRCGAAVGRYDWKGFKCACGGWVTPAFSLQRARVDDVVARPPTTAAGADAARQNLGIRMPPGSRSGNL